MAKPVPQSSLRRGVISSTFSGATAKDFRMRPRDPNERDRHEEPNAHNDEAMQDAEPGESVKHTGHIQRTLVVSRTMPV